MAFVIETSPKLPFIHTRMVDPVQKNDPMLIKSQLMDILARRKKHTTIYVGINLSTVLMQEDVPLVAIISQLAEIYHETRRIYQLELLIVIDPTLLPVVRYVAESLCVPILGFASYDTLNIYVRRRTEDTQPFSNKMPWTAATALVTDY
jgi:hypothetical protein